MRARPLVVSAALLILTTPAAVFAEVTRFEVLAKRDVSGGRSFGPAGAYEEVAGRLYFAVDPAAPANRLVVDLDKAPRNSRGRVEFSADVVIYRPREAARGNGIALIDVVNRGNQTLISGFDRPGRSTDPVAGDGFLFTRGFTIVCVGWEFDVPAREGAIRLDAPVAPGVRGMVRALFTPTSAAREFSAPEVGVYRTVDSSSSHNTLTVRNAPLASPSPIARSAWRLSGNTVVVETGFEPGRWYELAFEASDPPIGGVGFLAIRDAAAWLRHPSVLAPSKYVIAAGISQSGRFLRSFLYEGFNTDEHGGQALDGVMAHIAGAARIDLNRRWATPITQATYTATSFPFSDVTQRDPITKAEEGALENTRAKRNQPKIFYTNTGVEYWGGGRVAALVHTSIDGHDDLPLPANERVYFLTGAQHGPAAFPPRVLNGQQKENPTDYWWAMRALMAAMEQWIREGTPPPESSYPRVQNGTLVSAPDLAFPHIPGVRSPRTLNAGGRAANHFVARNGAPGSPLPLLVPQVDADGNERAGVRLPEVAVPLATVTGWNFRKPAIGADDQLFPLLGSWVPFAATRADRERQADPRPSLAERYRGRDDYLERIRAAANALVNGRYLLAGDVDDIVRRAGAQWDYVVGAAVSGSGRRE